MSDRKIRMFEMATALQAIFFAKKVPDAVMAERHAICKACNYYGTDIHRINYCTICGCNLSRDSNRVLNLIRYEENLPKWGCKHPERGKERGWRR